MQVFEKTEIADNVKYVIAAVLGALVVAFLNYGKITSGNWNFLALSVVSQDTVPLIMNFVFAPVCAGYFVMWQKIHNLVAAIYIGAGTVGLIQILTVTSATIQKTS